MCRFFGYPPSSLLIIHDELDLPFGTIKLKVGGGLAGHNGLKSIDSHLSSREFVRLRVGIGRPSHGSVSQFVLAPFSRSEKAQLGNLITEAEQIIDSVLRHGVSSTMKNVNQSKRSVKAT
jgi:PTH1 family peptidyl-tRNA hydrolase